jgi:hypothetical protein
MFVCTASSQSYHLDLYRGGNRCSVSVPVGYDDLEDINYFAMAGLGARPHGGIEYFFCFLTVDGEDKRETRIWDGTGLPAGISKQNRRDILSVVLRATEHLLLEVAPDNVYRITGAHLPRKALEKHRTISQIFIKCGYRIAATESRDGRIAWLMERD